MFQDGSVGLPFGGGTSKSGGGNPQHLYVRLAISLLIAILAIVALSVNWWTATAVVSGTTLVTFSGGVVKSHVCGTGGSCYDIKIGDTDGNSEDILQRGQLCAIFILVGTLVMCLLYGFIDWRMSGTGFDAKQKQRMLIGTCVRCILLAVAVGVMCQQVDAWIADQQRQVGSLATISRSWSSGVVVGSIACVLTAVNAAAIHFTL